MTFNEWISKRWYIGLISVVACGIIANLFIPTSFPTAIGFVGGMIISYLIYQIGNKEKD